jgi:hypothetical protein
MAPQSANTTALARRPEDIRADIARARGEIARSVAALTAEVSAQVDWREWVRRRPGLLLGCAFTFGLWLGWRR